MKTYDILTALWSADGARINVIPGPMGSGEEMQMELRYRFPVGGKKISRNSPHCENQAGIWRLEVSLQTKSLC